MGLVDPPNVAFEHQSDQVNNPKDSGAGENENNRQNNTHDVVFVQAAEQTVNCPNYSKTGERQNQFDK